MELTWRENSREAKLESATLKRDSRMRLSNALSVVHGINAVDSIESTLL